ncbi:MAG: arylsulfatase A-like enzyme [Candidatus Paceibacteria bacterium]|jgi:arylsulfatase A-like enzyme
MSEPSRVSRPKTLLIAVLLGAFIGSVQSLFRAFTLVSMVFGESGGTSEGHSSWIVFSQTETELPSAMLMGAIGGLWAWAWICRFRGSWLLALAGAGVAMAWIGSGGGNLPALSQSNDLAGPESPGGSLVLGVTALLSVLLVLTMELIGRSSAEAAKTRLALSLMLFGATAWIPYYVRQTIVESTPFMQVEEVRREVILEAGAWEVLESHPKQAPYVGILMPSSDYRVDAGELPSLIMAPPCAISFEVTEEDGPVLLEIAAGIDESVNWATKRKKRENVLGIKAFGFEIEVNGKSVFTREDPWEATGGKKAVRGKRFWTRPENLDDFKLKPGDKVVLRTKLIGVSDKVARKGKPQMIGFGNVLLKRHLEYKRHLSSPEAPSIVLIVQDTLRADRCSTYGYERVTTPALSKLAERGIMFSEAHSAASWTWPSTASILTGMLPDSHGVTDDSSCYLVSKNETLAEVLQQRGYTTGAFACNPLISEEKNFNQGFEYFSQTGHKFIKTPQIIEPIEEWLTQNGHMRFFLYLHLVDPHMPHVPSAEDEKRLANAVPDGFGTEQEVHKRYKGKALKGGGLDESGKLQPAEFPAGHIEYMSSMYDASVATGDQYLAEIMRILEELGLDENTVVAFTSDHGEAWMEHGGLTHGQSIHRELVAVPLVMAGPGLPKGVVCETPLSNRHIASTLATIGGAELSRVADSVLLTDVQTIPARPVFFSTTHGTWNQRQGRQPIYGVREGKWVLHFAPQGGDYGVSRTQSPAEGMFRLYDTSVDLEEHNDVSKEFPEIAERLKGVAMDKLAEQLKAMEGRLEIGGGAETMRMLDGIGYNVGRVPDEAHEADEEGSE